MFRTSAVATAPTTPATITTAPSSSSSFSKGQRQRRQQEEEGLGADRNRVGQDVYGLAAPSSSSSSSFSSSSFTAAPMAGGVSSPHHELQEGVGAASVSAAAPHSTSNRQQRPIVPALSSSSFSSRQGRRRSSDDDGGDEVEDMIEVGAATSGLRRSKSVAYSRSASFVASPTAPPTLSTMVRQFVVTLLATLVSWNLPRYLIAHETSIATKPVPYQVVGRDNLVVLNPELNQPLVEPPTIPSGFLVWTSIGVPLLGVVLVGCFTRPFAMRPYARLPSWEHDGVKDKDRTTSISATWTWLVTVHAGMCGALTSIGLVEGPTQLLKLYVQRPRPNFYALCQFNVQLRTCTAPLERIRDATFSFPSGHSSLASAGMVYLSYFLLSRIVHAPATSRSVGWLCRHRHTWALLSVLLPYAWCVFVAASRIVDMWHHPSDVLAGLVLGWFGATLSYHYWFPPIWVSAVPWSMWQLGGW